MSSETNQGSPPSGPWCVHPRRKFSARPSGAVKMQKLTYFTESDGSSRNDAFVERSGTAASARDACFFTVDTLSDLKVSYRKTYLDSPRCLHGRVMIELPHQGASPSTHPRLLVVDGRGRRDDL